jgi:hypothetical protein
MNLTWITLLARFPFLFSFTEVLLNTLHAWIGKDIELIAAGA